MASVAARRTRSERRPLWPSAAGTRLAVGAVCLLALVAYLAFPTYPTYDSLYALLWGRDLLHGQLPHLHVYRAPTEHPLALAFGALCSLFGGLAPRVMVLGAVASFVALAAGVWRLASTCFGPVVAAIAALLVLSRLFVENLALQGYLDVTYVALVVWAAALEADRPRRGWPVLALLCAAGLLRPEAWLLSGVYWLWWAWPVRARGAPENEHGSPPRLSGAGDEGPLLARRWAQGAPRGIPPRAGALALTVLAPVAWMACDALLTGDPLYSLRSTSGLAQQLGRAQGLASVLSSTWTYAVRIDKLPVVMGALAGTLAGLRLAPRRTLFVLALVLCLLAAYVLEGAAGASVLDRYMMAAAVTVLPLCALALGGWSLLERGSLARRAWMLAAVALAAYGVAQVNATVSMSSLRETLAYHEQLERGLASALRSAAVRGSLRRCPVLSLPNNKLVPDVQWLLLAGTHPGGGRGGPGGGRGAGPGGARGAGPGGGLGAGPGTASGAPASKAAGVQVVARSQAREQAAQGAPRLQRMLDGRSVAVYPLPVTHFFDAVAGVGEEPGAGHPPAGSHRIYASHYYAVYARC